MNIEKLPSGSYRVRKTINGVRKSFIFDQKPTKAMIEKEIAKATLEEKPSVKGTFLFCADQYIKVKENVLSVTTIKAYRAMLKKVPEDFLSIKIADMTQFDVQNCINNYSLDHKPKSTYNLHGFISAVLAMFRPSMVLHTTLPKKYKEEPYIPTDAEVSAILEAARDTRYWTPFCLATMSLRLSEVCALELSDLDDNNILTISKAKVRGEHTLVTKTTKTEASIRKIKLPDKLADRIRSDGFIYDGYPDKVNENLRKFQDQLGIKHFTYHKLRHYFASMAHSELGLSDADICTLGGWKQNSSVMRTVYRHSMQESVEKSQAAVTSKMDALF